MMDHLDLASIQDRLAVFQDPDRAPGGSAYTELYFHPEPRPEGAPPALVFHHIRKTAGSSFRQVLRKRLKRHPAVQVPSLRHGAQAEGTVRTREALLDWHRELYERLTVEEWRRLSAVTSHEASYFLPLLEAPALGFTLVREPVDRVVSRYYFANRPPKAGTERKRERGIGPGIGEELREWSLEQIFERVGGADPAELERSYAFGAFFNGQARSLLEPHHDISELTFSEGPPPDAELWRERLAAILDRHYLLGVSERFDEGVAAVAARYGWKAGRSERKKVNTARPATEQLPGELRDRVGAYNWLDAELYARAREQSDQRLRTTGGALPAARNKEYGRAAKSQKGRRVAIEVYLAAEPLPADQPTVVFQHLAKTAGTSLREVLHRNYAPRAEHVIVGCPPGVGRASAAARYYEGLSERERESLLCIAGHAANHVMYTLERPRRAITIVREPVDRVLSRFHFGGQKRGNAGVPHTLEDLFADPERLAREEPVLSRQYVNGQSRALLEPLFDTHVPALAGSEGPPADAELWRERLFEALAADYLVGVQERFAESVAGFAAELGWQEAAVPRAKVNRERPPVAEEDQALLERVRAFNWLDVELYEHARKTPKPPTPGTLPSKRNKVYQRAVRRGIRGSTFEVYFAPEPLPEERPTVVFQHIEKTAGTSIRDVLHRNYAAANRHAISEIPRGTDHATWCAEYYDGLSDAERQSIACVVGHPANHLMYRLERPYRAITMLREPVDRVLSRFHFGGSKRGDPGTLESLGRLFAEPARLAREEPALSGQYVNGQSRALLEPLFDIDVEALACSEGPADAELWRARLFEALEADYLVGVRERFEEAILRFGAEFDWTEHAAPRAKVNRERPPVETEDQVLLSRVRAYNWLDLELYGRYAG